MKSLKTKIMYIVNIVLAVLMYVFLSQSYITYTYDFGVSSGSEKLLSGYDIINHYFEGEGAEVMMALSNLLVTILCAVVILISIYGLLVSFGVIKESKFTKLANLINVIVSVALVIFGAISLICTFIHLDGASSGGNGLVVGWAVILNLILGLVTLVTSILASKFAKK